MRSEKKIFVKQPSRRLRSGLAVIFLLCCLAPASLSADIIITKLANQGVLVSDGSTRILIDAMVVEPYSVYGGLPDDVRVHFDNLTGPFSDVDLVLASHRHHEHNQPKFACQFMQNSKHTIIKSSSQVLGLMREKCRQFMTSSSRIEEIAPQYDMPVEFVVEGASVSVFPLSHGTGSRARIQHYGHLIRIGDLTLLHTGDATMNAQDFARAGLDTLEVDVVILPFWYFQPGPGGDIVERFFSSSRKVAMHIPPDEMQEVMEYMSESYPDVLVLPNTLDIASFSPKPAPAE